MTKVWAIYFFRNSDTIAAFDFKDKQITELQKGFWSKPTKDSDGNVIPPGAERIKDYDITDCVFYDNQFLETN